MNPKYPVYVVSKGRAESRLTVKALIERRIPHRVVIEPQEYEQYAAVISPETILVLPFSNLGQGSIPARNWIWEHALAEGHEQSLRDQHPDVVTITRKWNRWQHQVDYRPFKKNRLKRKPGIEIPQGVNEYGMRLVQLTGRKAERVG